MNNIFRDQFATVEGVPAMGPGYIVMDYSMTPGERPRLTIEMDIEMFKRTIGEDEAKRRREFDAFMKETIRASASRKRITKVLYNDPATIVWFSDGDKIVSKTDDDEFNKETGLAISILKKKMDKKTYNRVHPYLFTIGDNGRPLWDTLVGMNCPNGEWEKIKKEWKQK